MTDDDQTGSSADGTQPSDDGDRSGDAGGVQGETVVDTDDSGAGPTSGGDGDEDGARGAGPASGTGPSSEQVHKRERELDQRERGLEDMADELDERADALDGRARELQERSAELDRRETSLDERRQAIERRESELDDREVAIEEREADLDRRAAELDEKEQTLREYVGDTVQEGVREVVTEAVAQERGANRLGTIGSIVLGLVGVTLVVGGVLSGFADQIAAVPTVFESETGNLGVTVLLLFSGLAANLAAVAD